MADERVIRINGKDYVVPYMKNGYWRKERDAHIIAVTAHHKNPKDVLVWRKESNTLPWMQVYATSAKLKDGKIVEAEEPPEVTSKRSPIEPHEWHLSIASPEDRGKGLGRLAKRILTLVEKDLGRKSVAFPKWEDQWRIPKEVRDGFFKDVFKRKKDHREMEGRVKDVLKKPGAKLLKIHWIGTNPRKRKPLKK
ncbi:MAG: hypothetical protein KAW41_00125 [Candidatus Diapherotrites archaeon]|nr:hypothetical protein [Candidatus Diapherotrites archaeon]